MGFFNLCKHDIQLPKQKQLVALQMPSLFVDTQRTWYLPRLEKQLQSSQSTCTLLGWQRCRLSQAS